MALEGKIKFIVPAVSRFVGSDGRLLRRVLLDFIHNENDLLAMMRSMLLTRLFDEKAVYLQRIGRLGTFPARRGEEAISVGIGFALKSDDIFLPQYGEAGTSLIRGVSARDIFLFWGGDERGNAFLGNDFPPCIPIGTHLPHTVGVAYALKYKQKEIKRAALCVCGDGATSKEDFYGALNFAGVWNVPAIFVIRNNQWAISVPLRKQTATLTLAQKAIAAGVACARVDGNDVIAVRVAVEEALAHAREGKGPTVIEMITYRVSDHTTADDAGRYRSKEDVDAHTRDDPILRFKDFLRHSGVLTEGIYQEFLSVCKDEIEKNAKEYLETLPQEGGSAMDFLYEKLPPSLRRQRQCMQGEMED